MVAAAMVEWVRIELVIMLTMQVTHTSRPRLHLRRQLSAADSNVSSLKMVNRLPNVQLELASRQSSTTRAQGISIDRRTRISMDKLYGDCLFGQKKQEDSTKCSASTSRLTKLSSSSQTHSHLRTTSHPSPISTPPSPHPSHTPALSRYTSASQAEVYNTYYPPAEPSVKRERRWEISRVIKY